MPAWPPLLIDEIEEHLAERDDVEVFGDGEEHGDVYVFLIGEAAEGVLLTAAARVAGLPGVPAGVFAVVTDDEAEEFGLGRRVPLS